MDLISVSQKTSELVSNENCWFSGNSSKSSWMLRLSNSPFAPFACIENELSNKMMSSLPLLVVSLALKKGWAKAKIKQVNNNNRVANNNHFLISALFRV